MTSHDLIRKGPKIAILGTLNHCETRGPARYRGLWYLHLALMADDVSHYICSGTSEWESLLDVMSWMRILQCRIYLSMAAQRYFFGPHLISDLETTDSFIVTYQDTNPLHLLQLYRKSHRNESGYLDSRLK